MISKIILNFSKNILIQNKNQNLTLKSQFPYPTKIGTIDFNSILIKNIIFFKFKKNNINRNQFLIETIINP